ncbi:hypothetical protein HRbin17_01486 [bacterium HR17]|uniref:EamA domain-containing protein n=1 Tax=Candidatus Fervidibacter japonicus TaxID=2035412 RepID=A0A2H5XCR8_9BACT|nr:hypothetical protein HRbin17_01486 [bacterium HR17]
MGRAIGTKTARGVLLVNLATFLWATNALVGRWLRTEVGPFTLSAARVIIGAVIFAGLLRQVPPSERQAGAERWWLWGMTLSGVVLFSAVYYAGLRFTTAVNATLVHGFTPLLTHWLAAGILREPLSRRNVVAALAAWLGVVLIVAGNGTPQGWRVNAGDVLVLLSAALWSVYSVLARRVTERRSALAATGLATLWGAPVAVLLGAVEVIWLPPRWTPMTMAGMVYVGAVPMVIGFWAWTEGVRVLGTQRAALFYNTLPLYGAVLAHWLFGEPLTWRHGVGGVIIGVASWWATRPKAGVHALPNRRCNSSSE